MSDIFKGVLPAVTTKFTPDNGLDFAEMERCFALQLSAGVHGLIIGGSLGEGPMLTPNERLEIAKFARTLCGKKPVILTINEADTITATTRAKEAAKAGVDGLMVVPSLVYKTNHVETVANLRAIAQAADLPVMIYSNRVAYRVDVTPEIMMDLADDKRFQAIKESSDEIRRTTEIINICGSRYNILTGVDNLAAEALMMGAVGWVAGLVVAFPRETMAVYNYIMNGQYDRALQIYRWFRPLLDLDVSSYLVQNIKLVEAMAIDSNERVRLPRMPLMGGERERAVNIIKRALETRPTL